MKEVEGGRAVGERVTRRAPLSCVARAMRMHATMSEDTMMDSMGTCDALSSLVLR